jgi:PPP family 3-phenylpropionic acid transporter
MSQPADRSHAFSWLCGHWFCSIGALGVFYPFYALFLRENVGLPAAQVGLVLGIMPIVGLVAQPAWGHVADRTGSRVRMLVVLGTGTAVGYFALGHALDLRSVVLANVLLALFLTALTPMSVAVTYATVLTSTRFGHARVWGTLGYLLMVVCAPIFARLWRHAHAVPVIPGGPSEPGLESMFYLAALLSLAGAACALGLRSDGAVSQRAARGDLRLLLANPAFVRVLVFSIGLQLFISAPMQFFPIFVRSRGGSVSDVSRMWIWMLLLEAPLIFVSGRLFERFGVARVMTTAAAAGGLRWLICSCLPSLTFVYPVQLIHALVVTGISVGTSLYVEQVVPGRLRATAQALAVMMGSSIGGVASSAIAGSIMDRYGVNALYFGYGAGALLWSLSWWRVLGHDVTEAATA